MQFIYLTAIVFLAAPAARAGIYNLTCRDFYDTFDSVKISTSDSGNITYSIEPKDFDFNQIDNCSLSDRTIYWNIDHKDYFNACKSVPVALVPKFDYILHVMSDETVGVIMSEEPNNSTAIVNCCIMMENETVNYKDLERAAIVLRKFKACAQGNCVRMR